MRYLKCGQSWLPLPSELVVGVQPYLQPLLVSTNLRIHELHYKYGCPTLLQASVY